MKKYILLLSLFTIISCNQSYSRIEVNDQKSKIIQKIFDEVSSEKVEFLSKTFSDDMIMVNSKEVRFNKKEFLNGIEDMYDLFEDISFDPVDGDANGSEIETNYYSNGKIWTSVWNNFSAKGKYTGQKISFPFHISYQWEGDKIIEEYQFFDMTYFQKEANARASKNFENKKVGFILELNINKGKSFDDVKSLLEKLTSFMRQNEPDAYDYGYYISPNRKKVTLIEKYNNSEAAILHANNFENGPNMVPFLETFTIKSFILFGNSTNKLRERIKAYGVEPREPIGGWIN